MKIQRSKIRTTFLACQKVEDLEITSGFQLFHPNQIKHLIKEMTLGGIFHFNLTLNLHKLLALRPYKEWHS